MSFFLASCVSLKTRTDKGVKKESQTVLLLRQQIADLRAKNMEYEEQFRLSTGKIEELEIQARRAQDNNQKRLGEESQQLQAYKDSVAELVEEKKKLERQILALKEQNKTLERQVVSAKMTAKEHLDEGDKLFDDKKWTEAATEYQSYRSKAQNKKNEDYALATYKIGVCFQELGLNKEAKTFYKSVVSKHKGLKAAKYAQYRLSNLK
jgi:TolA-binding protein